MPVPQITQSYIVPQPSSFASSNSVNDTAVYSMWEHFLDMCVATNPTIVSARKTPLLNPFAQTNHYTGKNRLSVFINLSSVNA